LSHVFSFFLITECLHTLPIIGRYAISAPATDEILEDGCLAAKPFESFTRESSM